MEVFYLVLHHKVAFSNGKKRDQTGGMKEGEKEVREVINGTEYRGEKGV